jgi:hypothetical protein
MSGEITAIDLWLDLLEGHIGAGTGRDKYAISRAHLKKRRDGEWTVAELIDAFSDAMEAELSRNTLASWRNGSTFPTGDHLNALVQVFWPNSRLVDREPRKEFTTTLAKAKAFRRQRERKAREAAGLPNSTPSKRGNDSSPFLGLRSFGESDADKFFGRSREVREALAQFGKTRLLWVTGPSGNGKSSLVAAGLLPTLKAGALSGSERWQYITFTPGSEPLRKLYASLLDHLPLLRVGRSLHHLIGSEQEFGNIATEGSSIFERLSEHLGQGHANDEQCFVLFIDQFEECFTTAAPGSAAKFFKFLLAAIARSNLRIIATIRHDFLGQAIETPEIGSTFDGSSFFSLQVPRRDALREMIVCPAEAAGLTLEPGLTDRILDDTGDAPGALALMAYTLDELYKSRNGRELRIVDYELLGGVPGAIAARAEQVFQQLEMDIDTFHDLFGCLIEVNEVGAATRRRMTGSEVGSELVQRALIAYTDARLLTSSEEAGNHKPVYEVAHEAVFREWPKLRDWIVDAWDSHRIISHMERLARVWDQRQRPGHLLPNHEAIAEYNSAKEKLFHNRTTDAVLEAFLIPEQVRIQARLLKGGWHHEDRREMGDRLAAIGDSRPGVGVISGLPDLVWIRCQPALTNIDGRECKCSDFWITKFPITTLQFNVFLEADDGARDQTNWLETPSGCGPESIRKERNKITNTPRDTISWYQARAFARWLDRRQVGTLIRNLIKDSEISNRNWGIRLPTEAEWQIAAEEGASDRSYPWGSWDEQRANTNEAGLGRTVAVGMYPEGASSRGVEDLSGNVAEWCLSNYDVYNSSIDDDVSKMLKGGSFYHNSTHAQIRYRRYMLPSNAFSNFGFRLAFAQKID